MGFGLSPETVDNGFNTEFATTAVANNILLSKRVITWQDLFTPQLTDHMRKAILFTQNVVDDLKDMLSSDFDSINIELEENEDSAKLSEEMKKKVIINRALHEFLTGLDVTLPRPSSVTTESQANELKEYADALDVALDAYLSSEAFSKSVVGDLSDQQSTLKAQYKAYFLRQYMAEKNIFPELAKLVVSDDDGSRMDDITEEIVNYNESISKTATNALVRLTANVTAVNKDLAKNGVAEGNGFGSSSSDDSGSDSSSDDGLGGFSMDDGFGADADQPPVDDGGVADEAGTDNSTDNNNAADAGNNDETKEDKGTDEGADAS